MQRQSGFNLVELMIAMALGLLVILGAGSVFLSSKQSYRTNSAVSQIQESARIAFELLARDLRQARLTGCGNQQSMIANAITDHEESTDSTNWFANFSRRGLIAYEGDDADDASNTTLTTGTTSAAHVSGTDVLITIGASQTAYSIATGATTSQFSTVESPASDLHDGDVVVICDTLNADIAQISGTGPYTVVVGAPSRNEALLSTSYARNSQVSRLNSAIWYIGCNPSANSCDPTKGGTSLYRKTFGGGAEQVQEFVRGVASMQLAVLPTQSSQFVGASEVSDWSPNRIAAVRIGLRLVAEDRESGLRNQTITSDVFEDQTFDRFIFRDIEATVALRNPPLQDDILWP